MKILVLGDSCQDIYQVGRVDRISPEAPVPVFVPTARRQQAGMALNVVDNLVMLGARVDCVHRHTGDKTRYVDERSRQQLIRVDQDIEHVQPLSISDLPALDHDAVVISDYGKGSISMDLLDQLHSAFAGPVFVDTKKTNLADFENFWFKLNELECSRLQHEPKKLIKTLGRAGAKYQDRIHQAPAIPVTDVCGAGDTFLSALVFDYVQTHDIHAAIGFAVLASSITVQHWGVYAPTKEEIDEVRRKST